MARKKNLPPFPINCPACGKKVPHPTPDFNPIVDPAPLCLSCAAVEKLAKKLEVQAH